MKAILTLAALPTRAPSTLAEQMPAAKGVVRERRMTTIFACTSRLHSWTCFCHFYMTEWLHPPLDIQDSVPGCFMTLCFSLSATAWPCLLGGPPSPVSLNAVVIDARLSRGGPTFNSSSNPSSSVFHGFPNPRKPRHLQVSRWLYWWPVRSLQCWSMLSGENFQMRTIWRNKFFQSPCGTNADCESNGNRAVCKCRQGYEVSCSYSHLLHKCPFYWATKTNRFLRLELNFYCTVS